jgi:hypothetical protein
MAKQSGNGRTSAAKQSGNGFRGEAERGFFLG